MLNVDFPHSFLIYKCDLIKVLKFYQILKIYQTLAGSQTHSFSFGDITDPLLLYFFERKWGEKCVLGPPS